MTEQTTRYEVSTTNGRTQYPDRLSLMADLRGSLSGYESSPRLRVELQGQPKFRALCGPMWNGYAADGSPIVRYEDTETYRAMSI